MIDQLVLLGVSHQTAPVALRERIARLSESPELSLARLRGLPGVAEGMLLSTCNRVELYGAGAVEAVASGFRELLGREPQVVPHLYERRGEAALRHLFRVAASLDSMIVGEPQILGQLKQAYRAAISSGATGDTLHRAVGRAFAVAKRVRTETSVGRSAVSMVHAAVELSERVFALRGKRALVIGAGEMAGLVAQKLIAQGVGHLTIANRTEARAAELAATLAARCERQGLAVAAVGLGQLDRLLAEVDLVIAAVAVEAPLMNRERLAPLLRARRFRPLLFVDLSVPRAIDPQVSTLENVFAKDVDDIGRLVAQNSERRSEEAQRAEGIVAAEVEVFSRVLRGRSASPVLAELRRKGREVAEAELAHTLLRLGPAVGEEQRASIAAMAEAIVNKLLHEPTARLRAAAEAGQESALAEAAGQLFGLRPAQAVDSAGQRAPDSDREEPT